MTNDGGNDLGYELACAVSKLRDCNRVDQPMLFTSRLYNVEDALKRLKQPEPCGEDKDIDLVAECQRLDERLTDVTERLDRTLRSLAYPNAQRLPEPGGEEAVEQTMFEKQLVELKQMLEEHVSGEQNWQDGHDVLHTVDSKCVAALRNRMGECERWCDRLDRRCNDAQEDLVKQLVELTGRLDRECQRLDERISTLQESCDRRLKFIGSTSRSNEEGIGAARKQLAELKQMLEEHVAGGEDEVGPVEACERMREALQNLNDTVKLQHKRLTNHEIRITNLRRSLDEYDEEAVKQAGQLTELTERMNGYDQQLAALDDALTPAPKPPELACEHPKGRRSHIMSAPGGTIERCCDCAALLYAGQCYTLQPPSEKRDGEEVQP